MEMFIVLFFLFVSIGVAFAWGYTRGYRDGVQDHKIGKVII